MDREVCLEGARDQIACRRRRKSVDLRGHDCKWSKAALSGAALKSLAERLGHSPQLHWLREDESRNSGASHPRRGLPRDLGLG